MLGLSTKTLYATATLYKPYLKGTSKAIKIKDIASVVKKKHKHWTLENEK